MSVARVFAGVLQDAAFVLLFVSVGCCWVVVYARRVVLLFGFVSACAVGAFFADK